jgi:hypothetical protein
MVEECELFPDLFRFIVELPFLLTMNFKPLILGLNVFEPLERAAEM